MSEPKHENTVSQELGVTGGLLGVLDPRPQYPLIA